MTEFSRDTADDNAYIVSWCEEGLETVQPITNPGKLQMWEALTGEQQKTNELHMIWAMTMRARANSHRHYEIYLVTAVPGISADDITSMFEAAPQVAADTMRRIGTKVFSDRRNTKAVRIT